MIFAHGICRPNRATDFLSAIRPNSGKFSPFKFMSYVPAQIYLGRMNVVESLQAILLAGIWVAVLWIFLSVMYKRALRQYEGVGI